MNSLKRVMTVAKALRILYNIWFVFSIVGACLCLLSGVCLSVVDSMGLWENEELIGMIGDFSDLTGFELGDMDVIVYAAALSCVLAAILQILSYRFYRYVERVGDPFDRTVILKMQTLGIVHIGYTLASAAIGSAVTSVFGIAEFSVENEPALTLGIVYLLLTFVFSYAADTRAPKAEPAAEPTVEE